MSRSFLLGQLTEALLHALERLHALLHLVRHVPIALTKPLGLTAQLRIVLEELILRHLAQTARILFHVTRRGAQIGAQLPQGLMVTQTVTIHVPKLVSIANPVHRPLEILVDDLNPFPQLLHVLLHLRQLLLHALRLLLLSSGSLLHARCLLGLGGHRPCQKRRQG